MMNLCTEEVRGGNVCFYRCTGCRHRKLESFGGNKEASESWKADEEAKKKKRRHNKWSGIATFCIFNSVSYLWNDHFPAITQTLRVRWYLKCNEVRFQNVKKKVLRHQYGFHREINIWYRFYFYYFWDGILSDPTFR